MAEYRKQEFGNVGGWETGILGVLSSLFGLLFKSGDSGDRVVTTISEIERPSPDEMLERWGDYIEEVEATRPELSEAFEAVRGQIFGPVDAATVKLKHGEMIQTAKEKREFEQGLRDLVPGTREHREDRDRRDRQDQTRTLSWLLANDRAYRGAHEKAMSGLPELGRGLDNLQEKLDAWVLAEKRKLRDYLELHAARLSDGRFVFKDGTDENGKDVFVDDDFKRVTPGEMKGVDVAGTMTADDYRVKRKPVENAISMAEENRRDGARIAEIHEDLTRDDPPLKQEIVEAHDAEKLEIKDRFEERAKEFERNSAVTSEQKIDVTESLTTDVPAAVAVFKLN